MIVILGLLFLGAVAALPNYEGRIVGGSDAVEGEYPYAVILRRFGVFTCGGSILNEKYILTAAHCVRGSENSTNLFKVVYGTIVLNATQNVMDISRITLHPDPNMDIAIIELEEDIIMGDNVQPVQLPDASDYPGDDANAVLVGWGFNGTGGSIKHTLQKVDISIFNHDYCKSHESERYNPDYHICAGVLGGGKGQCNGDSGGPLTVSGIQYGVVAWSIKPCSNPNNPGVFAKVTASRVWIRQMTGV